LKEQIVAAANQHCGDDQANKISPDLLRIMKGDNTILDNDDDELSKSLRNNEIVNVVLKISDDEYEPVELETSTLDDGGEDPSPSTTK
jgi:hypothetical protein